MKKEKLELKHIAGYLPYGLKIVNIGLKGDVLNIYKLEIENHLNCGIVNVIKGVNQKPILRQLSDLTKEIEINGEKFVPIEWLDKNIKPTRHQSPSVSFTDGYIEMCYLSEYEKLYEWHFDIHGLIESNLAIDINTLQS